MTHDLIIRNGKLVDGLGGEPYAGDLAIDKGKIVEVGVVNQGAIEEFDAQGLAVSPGFIDLHTHLDAQVGWDRNLSPVSQHGVTTALIGNCGVTFAPCKPEDQRLLAGMMETVEDIPVATIMAGLPWDWVSYGDYLDSIERLGAGINIAGMIGHSALRFFVMGERAVEEQATPAEQQQMAQLVGEALDRGAVGFSTNRFKSHVLPDGRPIPGTFADIEELLQIAQEVGKRNALFQTVGMKPDHMKYLADNAGCRMLFNSTLSGVEHDESGIERRDMVAKLSEGRDISGVAQVRGSGMLLGLQSLLPIGGPVSEQLGLLSIEEKLAALEDADVKSRFIAAAKEDKRDWPEWLYYLGAGPHPDHSLGEHNHVPTIARNANEHWGETFIRLTLETRGKALFHLVNENRNLKALRDLFDGGRDLLKGGRVLPGLGDAGAHVGMVMDAGWATFVLSHWVREEGLFTLGEGVERMTSAPARILGLHDRGALQVGMRADINIFDPDTVAEGLPYRVHDFPGGAPRLTLPAYGYKATLVNGAFNVLDGEYTGNHAGNLIRSGH